MDALVTLLLKTALQVWETFLHNWYFLVISAVIATVLKLYVDQNQVAAFLRRNQATGVLAATAAAVGTPLCSCGTTAVILGMMASMMPWAPIIAFMVSSPLTSPEELIYSAGLFGWPFAIAFFVASIVLGLLGGLVGHIFDRRGWLAGQARFVQPVAQCCAVVPALAAAVHKRVDFKTLAYETWDTGRRLLVFFLVFAFVGYGLNNLIPSEWIAMLFGPGHVYGVPLAATLGLPFYLNTEVSLPLLRAMLDGGMSSGAALAFLITGAGTSIGAIAGALTIARWRVVGLVIGTLWFGAVLFGLAADALALF